MSGECLAGVQRRLEETEVSEVGSRQQTSWMQIVCVSSGRILESEKWQDVALSYNTRARTLRAEMAGPTPMMTKAYEGCAKPSQRHHTTRARKRRTWREGNKKG